MTPIAKTLPRRRHGRSASLLAATCMLLAACASTALHDAQELSLQGHPEQALGVLDAARSRDPADHALQAAQQRQRELTISVLANQAAAARAGGRMALASDLLARLEALDPAHPRTIGLREELRRDARRQAWLAGAAEALDAGRIDEAQASLRNVLVEAPGLPAARALQQRIAERTAEPGGASPPGLASGKRMTLEFHDAPLRGVFESVGRTMGVNFVFDKDVRTDARVTVLLREVTLDEAMRVVLATQQLDRKMLNESTMLIYANTPAKQQEHQDLVTRSFYLTNSDTKQAQALIKTLAKTRDIFVDERLNLIIVRDTAEVIQLIERLIASIDLPEPEVTLEVEVMEIGTNELDALGLQWPDTVQFGVPNVTGQVSIAAARSSFTTSVLNPALAATLSGSSGTTNLIANPKLRARNHEKAKIQIGERLPVFTASAVANVGTTTAVSYVDTGLMLEVEPSVQLDNDVVIKVNLDVTNLIGQVSGPQGSIAYRVGTRNATTSLRLHDGETQILAGLINDEDSKATRGVPGISELPVLGRLFGVRTDTRNKSEIVLLITPRVVRNIGLPDAATLTGAGGNFANPGAPGTRIRAGGAIAMPTSRGARPGAAAQDADGSSAPEESSAMVEVTTTAKGVVGGTVSVTLRNRSAVAVHGQFGFDATLLQSAGLDKSERVDFTLDPMGQKVYVLRVLASAAGKSTQVQVDGLSAAGSSGAPIPVKIEGDLALEFAAR